MLAFETNFCNPLKVPWTIHAVESTRAATHPRVKDDSADTEEEVDMAHKVRFSIPERELGKADIEFKVNREGARFGTLKISKGSVVWVRAGAQ